MYYKSLEKTEGARIEPHPVQRQLFAATHIAGGMGTGQRSKIKWTTMRCEQYNRLMQIV